MPSRSSQVSLAVAASAALSPCSRPEIFELFTDKHARVQPPLLGHIPEATALSVAHGRAVPADGPGIEIRQPEDRPHGRCLARTVGPEETDNLSLRHFEREVVECGQVPDRSGGVHPAPAIHSRRQAIRRGPTPRGRVTARPRHLALPVGPIQSGRVHVVPRPPPKELPHGLGAVQALTNDVGVPRVLCRFGDDVEEYPSSGPVSALLEPRRLGQWVTAVEVGQGGDDLVGASCHFVVLLEQVRPGCRPGSSGTWTSSRRRSNRPSTRRSSGSSRPDR